MNIAPHLFLPLQSSEHDANRSGTSFWTDGGRVTDQWCTDSPTADDGFGDAEDSQGKFPPRAAVEVQELFPDGQQTRRRGTLRCSAPGSGLLRTAERILQLAGTPDPRWYRKSISATKPESPQLDSVAEKNEKMFFLIPVYLD